MYNAIPSSIIKFGFYQFNTEIHVRSLGLNWFNFWFNILSNTPPQTREAATYLFPQPFSSAWFGGLNDEEEGLVTQICEGLIPRLHCFTFPVTWVVLQRFTNEILGTATMVWLRLFFVFVGRKRESSRFLPQKLWCPIIWAKRAKFKQISNWGDIQQTILEFPQLGLPNQIDN